MQKCDLNKVASLEFSHKFRADLQKTYFVEHFWGTAFVTVYVLYTSIVKAK